MMRKLRYGLAGTFLMGILGLLSPGCDGGGANDLQKPPEPAKVMDPMKDMPGYKESAAKGKAVGAPK